MKLHDLILLFVWTVDRWDCQEVYLYHLLSLQIKQPVWWSPCWKCSARTQRSERVKRSPTKRYAPWILLQVKIAFPVKPHFRRSPKLWSLTHFGYIHLKKWNLNQTLHIGCTFCTNFRIYSIFNFHAWFKIEASYFIKKI